MRNSSSSSASSVGDLALCLLFFGLSLAAGALVVTVLLVATEPVVSMFPLDSGAREIVLGVSLMWGVVTGCIVAVLIIGPWRRLRARAQIEFVDEAEAVPLELVGRPLPRRRVANDVRAYALEDDDYADALPFADEAELPRRRAAAGQGYARRR